MKKNSTFLVFLMLISIISFAQKEQFENNSFSGKVLENEHIDMYNFHKTDHSPNTQRNMLLNTLKHRMDSIVFSFIDGSNEKQVLTYDSHGNCILSVEYIKDNNDDWKNGYKTDYTFDIFGNQTSMINSTWLEDENRWRYSHKMKYVYDGQGLGLISYRYSWNDDLETWELRWKENQSINILGNINTIISFSWNDVDLEWNEARKADYTYNNDGLLSTRIYYNWISHSDTWLMAYQYEYNYDSYNNLISILNIMWLNDIPTNQDKTEYLYNEDGNMTESISYDWKVETDQWVEQVKSEISYDELGNITQFITSEWNSWDMLWMNIAKTNLIYNTDIPFDEVLWPFDDEDDMFNLVSMLIGVSQQEITEDNEWGDYMSADLNYSEYLYDFLDEENILDIQLFPNPVSRQFSFHIPDSYQQVRFELYDLQGRIMMKKDVENKEYISVENLNPGVYIYSITSDGKTQRGKLIKE